MNETQLSKASHDWVDSWIKERALGPLAHLTAPKLILAGSKLHNEHSFKAGASWLMDRVRELEKKEDPVSAAVIRQFVNRIEELFINRV